MNELIKQTIEELTVTPNNEQIIAKLNEKLAAAEDKMLAIRSERDNILSAINELNPETADTAAITG